MDSTSPANTINAIDHYKALRTAMISLGSVFLTAGLESVLALLKGNSVDFGQYGWVPLVAIPLISYAIDLLRRGAINNAR